MTFIPMKNDLERAVTLLARGELVGMPTETVYGLAGDAMCAQAIAKIYEIKGRPSFNPLIIHSCALEKLEEVAVFTEAARMLAQHFWPGPLTLVLPRQESAPVDLLASAGLPTVAVRIPQHPIALSLLKAFGKPLAAPSANLSNHISPTNRAMVLRDFPTLHVLEGGNARVGLESTIMDLTGDVPTILRPGGIPLEEIEAVVGPVALHKGDAILAPGMTKKHYAPKHPLRLNAVDKRPGEILIGFGKTPGADLNLSPTGNLVEAAANLYKMLNEADERVGAHGFGGIAVVPIPQVALGQAINDRLRRAAG